MCTTMHEHTVGDEHWLIEHLSAAAKASLRSGGVARSHRFSTGCSLSAFASLRFCALPDFSAALSTCTATVP